MITMEIKRMGRFAIEFEVANNLDVQLAKSGHLEAAKVRRVKLSGVIDSGATRLVLPASVVKQLGLPMKKEKVKVRYADGRRGLRNEVEEAHVYMLGRDGVFKAVVEPKRETALIGAIVMEDLDFVVDCTGQQLVPRDPHYIVNEIE